MKKILKHMNQVVTTLIIFFVAVIVIQFIDTAKVLEKDTLIRIVLLAVTFVGSFLLILFFQDKYINQPLLEIEDQVERIDFDKNPDFYIVLDQKSILNALVLKLNSILSKTNEMIREIYEDKEELQALNEELEASFGQLVAMEQEVTKQKVNFEALFRNSQNAIAMFDHVHNVMDCNKGFEMIFGYQLSEMLGKNLDSFVSVPEHIEDVEVLTKQIFDGKHITTEGVRYTKYGLPLEVSIQGVPMLIDGHIVGGYAIYSDISERKIKERHLAHISTHDYLTDLYNRTYFDNQLSKLYRDTRKPQGFIMMDINGLKLINDAFGHVVGDMVLVETANRIKEAVSSEEIVARLGSDEFGILVVNGNGSTVEQIAEKVKRQCSNMKLGEVEISISIGWSEFKQNETSERFIMRTAEDNMNRFKLMETPSVRGKAVYAIVNTLHEKNKREEEHSRRVGILSHQLGLCLGVSSRELNALKSMGLLHDIGKIAIEERILNKSERLTPEEYVEIKKHPEIGYRILSSVNELSEMAEYVLCHHESWDGSGYPRGLKGEEIPYLSRIISITDAYDAMTSDRAYRKAMTKEAAQAELSRCSGSQFDPEIVSVFLKHIDKFNEI